MTTADKKQKRKSMPHTTREQVEILVCFLEETPKALRCLKGESGGKNSNVQSGQEFSDKKMVYAAMAKVVNKKGKIVDKDLKWTDKIADNRWSGIYSKYTRTVAFSSKTGQGVDARKDGDKTLDEKLDEMCPCFSRLDALFGSRQSVRPTSVMMSALPKKLPSSAARDDDDDDDDEDEEQQENAAISGNQLDDDDDDDYEDEIEHLHPVDNQPVTQATKRKVKSPPPKKKPSKKQQTRAKDDDDDDDDDDGAPLSQSLASGDIKKLSEKFDPKSAANKSNQSFASQYAKAEEVRLSMLKADLEFQKEIQTKRFELEQQRYKDEQKGEREKMKSAARLELIRAGLRGQELLDELELQFPRE